MKKLFMFNLRILSLPLGGGGVFKSQYIIPKRNLIVRSGFRPKTALLSTSFK